MTPELPEGPFDVILADPPWNYQNWSEKKNGAASSHYETMSVEQLESLPIGKIAAKDCALFMWTTWPKLIEDAPQKILRSWGFRLVTCAFVWVKTYRDGSPYCGLGFYTRSATEPCLLAVRGKPKRLSQGVRQVIEAPVGLHSAKPEEQYARIEALYAGPYVELFARGTPRSSTWTVWGHEAKAHVSV